jgi:hypothetical protein
MRAKLDNHAINSIVNKAPGCRVPDDDGSSYDIRKKQILVIRLRNEKGGSSSEFWTTDAQTTIYIQCQGQHKE